jgi:hypothetical protein
MTKDEHMKRIDEFNSKRNDFTLLPDGSGASIMSRHISKDHWIYADGLDNPPMPFRCGTDNSLRLELVGKISEAARYAVRASTMNGRDPSFDPDAMVRNFVVGVLGYYTSDALGDHIDNPDVIPAEVVSVARKGAER